MSHEGSKVDYRVLAPYVRFVHEVEVPAGAHLRERLIYDHEFLFVVEGTGTLRIEDRTYPMKGGDLLYIRPYLPNEMKVDGIAPMHCFAVHFDYMYLGEAYDFSAQAVYLGKPSPAGSAQERSLSHRPRIGLAELDIPEHLPASPLNRFYETFGALRYHFENQRPHSPLELRASMLSLISLIHQALTTDKGIRVGHPHSERVLQAMTFIQTNYAARITVPMLAGRAGLTPKYFGTVFAQAAGMTVPEYVMKVRLEAAKRLLQNTRLSVGEIAEQVGFGDIYYFSKMFKRAEGLPPKQYAQSVAWPGRL